MYYSPWIASFNGNYWIVVRAIGDSNRHEFLTDGYGRFARVREYAYRNDALQAAIALNS